MAWIRLHLKHNGNAVYVNTNNISCINNDGLNKDGDATNILFVGGEDDYILVEEYLDEVMEQIETSESISMAVSALYK